VSEHHDHYEDEAGLPEPLPENETVLWQGAPDWRSFAVSAFHVRKLTIYFAVLLVIRVIIVAESSGSLEAVALSATWFVLLSCVALGILLLMAWLTERTTVYTLTNKRLLMRIGVALPMTINLPFSKINRVDLRLHRANGDESDEQAIGDIPVTLDESQKLSYVIMWPHAKPWSFSQTQAMLRAIPNAARVAELLADAIVEANQPGTRSTPLTENTSVEQAAVQRQSQQQDWHTNSWSGASS